MASKKKSDFGVMSDEPCGTTFAHGGFPKLAGASNTKKKAQFGVEHGPSGMITFPADDGAITFPNADSKPKSSKVIDETSGQGDYSPNKKGPEDFGGSVGVKGTMKSGKTDRKKQGF